MAKVCFLVFAVHLMWVAIVTISAQRIPERNPYSLQAAIDVLHHREAQLALRDYENANRDNDEEPPHLGESPEVSASNLRKQKQINRLLAKYLEQDEANEEQDANEDLYDDNDGDQEDWYNSILDERKRSVFRERDADEAEPIPYQSVFRERELEGASSSNPSSSIGYYNNAPQSELAQDFLREIDHERNLERDQLYRENLRRVLAKYEQQQENAIEREILADELQRNVIMEDAHLQHELKEQNSHHQHKPSAVWDGAAAEVTVEKRRLVLPWLPASRRKRFPISKRSPVGHSKHDREATNENVARDLQAIFGEPGSSAASAERRQQQLSESHKIAKKSDRTIELQDHSQHHDDFQDMHQNDQDHIHHHNSTGEDVDKYKNDQDSFLEHDHDHEEHLAHSHEDDHPHEIEHSSHSSTNPHPEELKLDQLIGSAAASSAAPATSTQDATKGVANAITKKNKKSIQWSKYFGLDRKKKSVDDWFMSPHKSHQYQRENEQAEDEDIDRSESVSRNEISNEKIDNIDRKLKALENHIIEDTVKYTGANDGTTNPEDLEKLKKRVISRLATAYSLEKMRRALNKLRKGNDQQSDSNDDQAEKKFDGDKAKRVAIKKEKVEFDNKHHTIDSAAEGDEKKVSDTDSASNNGFEESPTSTEDDKKKKKKRNDSKSLFALSDDTNDDEYPSEFPHGQYDAPQRNYDSNHFRNTENSLSECPILDAIDKRCESVDLLGGGGRRNIFERDSLLPACSMHQFCYLCGTSQTFCDFQYLSETEAVCGTSKECKSAAHLVLMILRGSTTGPQQVGPKECAKNPCLLQAMKNVAGY